MPSRFLAHPAEIPGNCASGNHHDLGQPIRLRMQIEIQAIPHERNNVTGDLGKGAFPVIVM
jgi:hypothetical protein